jgi:hypothetical protein
VKAERAEEKSLFQKALWLRILLAVALHLFVDEGFFAPDQFTYDRMSRQLAAYWAGRAFRSPDFLEGSPQLGYYYLVASLYTLFGAWSLIPKLVNAVAGALSVRVVYDLAMRLTDDSATALRAATYVAFLPSIVLWSALNIRDCWVILMILLMCRSALALQENFRPSQVVVIGASAYGLLQFRSYILPAVVGPILIAFFLGRGKRVWRNAILGGLLAAGLAYMGLLSGGEGRLQSPDLETLQQIRASTGLAGSTLATEVDIATPTGALAFLPVGVAIFLLAPFPLMVSGLRQALTVPEMLFLYTLILPTGRGIVVLLKQRLAQSLPILLVAVGLTIGYGLGQSNVGTAYRHRAQVLPLFLIFAAAGIEARRRVSVPSSRPAGRR